MSTAPVNPEFQQRKSGRGCLASLAVLAFILLLVAGWWTYSDWQEKQKNYPITITAHFEYKGQPVDIVLTTMCIGQYTGSLGEQTKSYVIEQRGMGKRLGSGDGLLVRDLDGNGSIDSGRELFGNNTLLADGVTKAANGFAALAELDSNADGKVDSSDAAWSELQVWIDGDSDGVSQAGEILTMAQAGVAAINLGYTASSTVDANGNVHKQIGTFTRADGSTAAAEDVWFASDVTDSKATVTVDVPAGIQALPDAKGFGTVYDLRQAMAMDATGHLKSLVESYVGATDAEWGLAA